MASTDRWQVGHIGRGIPLVEFTAVARWRRRSPRCLVCTHGARTERLPYMMASVCPWGHVNNDYAIVKAALDV